MYEDNQTFDLTLPYDEATGECFPWLSAHSYESQYGYAAHVIRLVYHRANGEYINPVAADV